MTSIIGLIGALRQTVYTSENGWRSLGDERDIFPLIIGQGNNIHVVPQ